MPIFEYECIKCGQRTEHLQLSSTAPLSACPECDGEVRKLMSAPAFQFKGSGWYVTDYAGKGKGGEGAKENASSSTEGSKKSGDSDGSSGGTTGKSKASSAKTSSPSD